MWELHHAVRFARFAAEWNQIHRVAAAPPFLHPEFIGLSLKHFGSGKEILALHRESGRITAVTVLEETASGRWQTFQPSQLPLGAFISLNPGAVPALVDSLIRRLPRFAFMLGVTQQDPLLSFRPADTASVRTIDYIQTAWVDVSGPFQHYWIDRGKNLKQNLRKARNRAAQAGIEPRLEIITLPRDVAAAMRDYGRLESAGWKQATGTAVHAENVQGGFYRDMLEAFLVRGAGCIYRYWFNDAVVAMDLCVHDERMQVILKTTYDEQHKAFSPASLMRQEALQRQFEAGRPMRVEYYGRLMEWHTRWTDNVRQLYHINAYRFGFLAHIHERLRMRRQQPQHDMKAEPQGAT